MLDDYGVTGIPGLTGASLSDPMIGTGTTPWQALGMDRFGAGSGIGSYGPSTGSGYLPTVAFADPTQVHQSFANFLNALSAQRDLAGQAQQIRQTALSQPFPTTPAPTALDAIAAVAGNLLDRRHVAGTAFLQNLQQGLGVQQRQQIASQERGDALANVQAQGLEQQGALGAQSAQAGYTGALQQYSLDQRNALAMLTREQMRQRQIEQNLNSLQTAYAQASRAHALGSMQQIADRMRNTESQYSQFNPNYQPTAPSADQVQSDYDANMIQAKQAAAREWSGAIRQNLNAFGEVPQGQISQLNDLRQQIADKYGLSGSADSFQPIPTGDTLRKQALDEKRVEFEQRFGPVNDMMPQSLRGFTSANPAQSPQAFRDAAELRYQSTRLQQYLQNMAAGGTTLNLPEWNAALAGYQNAQRQALVSSQPALSALSSQIQSLTAGLKTTDPNFAKQKAKVDTLQQYQNWLRQQATGPSSDTFRQMMDRLLSNAGSNAAGTLPIAPSR